MRRTKANRALTFVMAAALLIGSIHGVGAKEQSKAYDAPELTLTQGVTDYDLTEGITYDSEKYTLSVTDTGNFDINVAGNYEISYALMEKESSVNETESVENTESADIIESTETVSGTETVDTTETIENTDQTPEGDVTNTGDAQENQVITFQRTVTVKAAGEENALYEAPDLYLEQGQEDYNLASGLVYDNNKYKLDVTDNGNFDIMLSGEYRVAFVLNPLEETPDSEGNIGDADASDADQAEDTFVIPDGITTFTRRVVVTPGIALLSVAGNTINNNYPWASDMSDTSVTLNVPKDDAYVGTPVLQWTKESTFGKDDITDNSWENVPNVTVTDKKVILTGDSLVDGKWYRFKFSDDDYSEAVRIVRLDFNDKNSQAYKGNKKIPISFRYSYDPKIKWYISNDQIMYTSGNLGDPYNNGRGGNFDVFFYFSGAWNSSTYDGIWFAATETTANKMLKKNERSDKISPIRFYFDGDLLFVNIKPVDKAYSIMADINLGDGTYTGNYGDNLYASITDNRKIHQLDFVGKSASDSYQPDQLTMIVKSYTEICKWSIADYNYFKFFGDKHATEVYGNTFISLSFENQNDILLSYTATTLDKSHIVTNNVKFESGDGTFTETGKKQEYLFYDNEVLGTQQVYPPTINTNKVIEKIPAVTPNNNAENFLGWKLSVSGTTDGDIDLNKLYSDDEVAALKYKDAYKTMTFTAQYGVEQAQIFTGGTTAAQKYATVEQALKDAASGDMVKIITDGKITPTTADGVAVAKDVTLQPYNDASRSYQTTVSSKLAVDEDSVVTLMDGKLKLSAQASIKVFNPTDGQTYQVTAPDCTSWVTVDDKGDSPYFMGEADGSVKIDAVTYSYQNPSQDNLAMVYIPQGMKNNDQVTKAEVAADQAVTIEVDNTDSVVLNGSGNAGDAVTVERRTGDSKVDVKLPSGAQGTIFGHAVGAAPSGSVTVSQSSAENTGYPARAYILIAAAGDEAEVDGFTYSAASPDQKFYLGTFQADTTFGANAGVKGTKPADPHYLEAYTITICPDTGYDLDKDNFVVTMKDNDTADAKNLAFATYCTEEADGSIKVTIPQVTGDITIHAEAKKQTSKLTINGLDGRGIVKVLDGEGQVHELKQGKDSVTVNRNEELTLTFIPNDFTNPYYGDLTGEKGSSFSILTGLKDNTPAAAVDDLFTQDVKDSFNWTEKSYQVKYTPDKAENTLEAAFTHSSIMHVHVTGGTAEVNTPGLVQNPTDTGSFRHVIVPDNTPVQVTLKDTTAHTTVYKTAYWKQTSAAGGNDTGTEVYSNRKQDLYLHDTGSECVPYAECKL